MRGFLSFIASRTSAGVERAQPFERPQRVEPRRAGCRDAAATICCSAGTTDLSCFRTSSRCAVSRHQPFGCVKCATSCAGVSLYIRGGAKSGAIAGIAGCPMFVAVAGTAARPS